MITANATRKPPAVATGTRSARHVWPRGCIRTLVSRPGRLVNCGSPERISFHSGWLLSGCACCWLACDLACAASCGDTAGDCAAAWHTNAKPTARTAERTTVNIDEPCIARIFRNPCADIRSGFGCGCEYRAPTG